MERTESTRTERVIAENEETNKKIHRAEVEHAKRVLNL